MYSRPSDALRGMEIGLPPGVPLPPQESPRTYLRRPLPPIPVDGSCLAVRVGAPSSLEPPDVPLPPWPAPGVSRPLTPFHPLPLFSGRADSPVLSDEGSSLARRRNRRPVVPPLRTGDYPPSRGGVVSPQPTKSAQKILQITGLGSPIRLSSPGSLPHPTPRSAVSPTLHKSSRKIKQLMGYELSNEPDDALDRRSHATDSRENVVSSVYRPHSPEISSSGSEYSQDSLVNERLLLAPTTPTDSATFPTIHENANRNSQRPSLIDLDSPVTLSPTSPSARQPSRRQSWMSTPPSSSEYVPTLSAKRASQRRSMSLRNASDSPPYSSPHRLRFGGPLASQGGSRTNSYDEYNGGEARDMYQEMWTEHLATPSSTGTIHRRFSAITPPSANQAGTNPSLFLDHPSISYDATTPVSKPHVGFSIRRLPSYDQSLRPSRTSDDVLHPQESFLHPRTEYNHMPRSPYPVSAFDFDSEDEDDEEADKSDNSRRGGRRAVLSRVFKKISEERRSPTTKQTKSTDPARRSDRYSISTTRSQRGDLGGLSEAWQRTNEQFLGLMAQAKKGTELLSRRDRRKGKVKNQINAIPEGDVM